jgi:4-hydroxy-3-methylbut-2-enyl diphosphate reductase
VRKAHQALAILVEEGCHPVVIGQSQHVEVRGLVGDFPQASVLLNEAEAPLIAPHAKLGVISQTTQPLERALQLVQALKETHLHSEVRFIDTVCHPTKQRQTALEELCRNCEIVIIIIGGKNSNNTRQLTEKASRLGVRAHQIETPEDIQEEWFTGITEVRHLYTR